MMASSRAFSTTVGSYGTNSTNIVASSAKSHVLAGVQDAYWSDDEAEDTECPLCLEELDLSDLNFKPCTCGYQICRFCWHHIKGNLNGRCPACRREYTDEGVQFKPISPEDQKRLNQQKRQRERERKELEQLKRSHLVNVRVVQRNLVYVTGMGSRFAKEELIPTLRSTEYFGKYGKISKIVLVKRTQSNSGAPVVGMYITYHRREDAARAIAAVDGTASPGGDNEVARASYGTTKYCMSFLRNLPCTNHGCLDLHEWGDEKDCFTKEDLTTLKHAMKDTENHQRVMLQSRRKADESDVPALPRSASWGQKGGTPVLAPATVTPLTGPSAPNGRPTKVTSRGNRPVPATAVGPSRATNDATSVSPSGKGRGSDRKLPAQNAISAAASSLPAKPSAAVEVAAFSTASTLTSSKFKGDRTMSPTQIRKHKPAENSPTPPQDSRTVTAEGNSHVPAEESPSPIPSGRVQYIRSESVPPLSPASTTADSLPSTHTPPPPPGLPLPTSQPAGTSAYQLSNQARALMDDVLNRRSSSTAATVTVSPFPDFDKTLANLGDGSFTFNLTSDPKVARSLQDEGIPILPSSPTTGSFFDPFSAGGGGHPPSNQQFGVSASSGFAPRRPPSSTGYANSPLSSVAELDSRMSRTSGSSTSYAGSFNPFSDGDRTDSPAPSSAPAVDDDPLRRGSKFGFARKDSSGLSALGGSATNSPLRFTDTVPLPATPSFSSSEAAPTKIQNPILTQSVSWAYARGQEYNNNVSTAPPGLSVSHERPSPRLQYQSASANYGGVAASQQHAFSSFGQSQGTGSHLAGNDLSINLRDLLNLNNRQQDGSLLTQTQQPELYQHSHQSTQQAFPGHTIIDPAIMSVGMGTGHRDAGYTSGNQIPPHTNSPMGLAGPAPLGLNNLDTLPSFGRRPSSNSVSMASPTASNEGIAASALTNETLLSQSSSPSPVLSQSDFPSLPTPARPAPKERVPLVIPNLQPSKPVATTSHHPISPVETKSGPPTVSAVRQIIPLPPKPSAETLEAASKQEARKPSSAALYVEATAPEPVPPSPVQPSAPPQPASKTAARKSKQKATSPTAALPPLPVVEQEALISRKTKKNKPAMRSTKLKKDHLSKPKSSEEGGPDADNTAQFDESDATPAIGASVTPTEVDDALERLAFLVPIIRDYYLENISFFSEDYVNVANPQMGYESLVRALSALSNGSPIDTLPVEAIDAAVTSFQQLLEMLSQTISDLLRLLPRLTWTDTASLDTMLKDMIRSGELMEEDGLGAAAAAAEAAYDTRTDDFTALTDALSKRARWMEAQLVKLESLHHDVNLAAVRVVMYFNDRGWDHAGKLPRSGDALARFDAIGNVKQGNDTKRMTVSELEAELTSSLQEEAQVEVKLREAIQGNRRLLAFSAH